MDKTYTEKIKRLFYFAWLELKRNLAGVKYFAEADVTDNCNLRCRHCYHFHGKNDFEKKEFTAAEWRKRFKSLHETGVRIIMLVGGEPALRQDVLMLADEIFPIVYVITNGTIRIRDDFKHILFVSLEGGQKINDYIRGEGTFQKTLKNYSGDGRVIINMTLQMENYKELEKVVKIAKDNGFRGVVCNICQSGTHADKVLYQKSVKIREREIIIKEVERVKALYPKDFLISKSMIKWYKKPDHKDGCYWSRECLHFDVSWNKRRCFLKNVDCSNCGCFAGTFQNPLLTALRYPRETKMLV
ncbi:MAG: radical SAM protein [Candidatus Aenigmarchaeota archaeon]|nr:radical SAM protein [Candidatus Aenigmarchaeota archaeon]